MNMARKICSKTGKTKYPTRLEAQLAMADIQRSNAHHHHRKYREEPVRVYPCEHCSQWHMTSQTENRRTVSS